MEPLSEAQLGELQGDLSLLAEELRRQVDLSEDAVKPVDLDEPIGRLSRMDAMQQQAMAKASRAAARARLQQVDAALERCSAGEYGLCVECVECEDGVGYGRLKARPEALLCIRCQSELESRT